MARLRAASRNLTPTICGGAMMEMLHRSILKSLQALGTIHNLRPGPWVFPNGPSGAQARGMPMKRILQCLIRRSPWLRMGARKRIGSSTGPMLGFRVGSQESNPTPGCLALPSVRSRTPAALYHPEQCGWWIMRDTNGHSIRPTPIQTANADSPPGGTVRSNTV